MVKSILSELAFLYNDINICYRSSIRKCFASLNKSDVYRFCREHPNDAMLILTKYLRYALSDLQRGLRLARGIYSDIVKKSAARIQILFLHDADFLRQIIPIQIVLGDVSENVRISGTLQNGTWMRLLVMMRTMTTCLLIIPVAGWFMDFQLEICKFIKCRAFR